MCWATAVHRFHQVWVVASFFIVVGRLVSLRGVEPGRVFLRRRHRGEPSVLTVPACGLLLAAAAGMGVPIAAFVIAFMFFGFRPHA